MTNLTVSNLSNTTVTELNDIIKSQTFRFDNYGNPFDTAELELAFNTVTKTISWNGCKPYTVASRVILVQHKFKFDVDDVSFSACDGVAVARYIWRSAKRCKNYREAEQLLSSLVGTVLIGQWESDDVGCNNYNTSAIQLDIYNVVDVQKVIRDNEVVAFHVDANGNIMTKRMREGNSVWTKGCLEFASKTWGFALPDKTNSKRAVVGDGLGCFGVSADGNVSMVDADKSGKFFNRHAMIKHISAEVDEPVADNLMVELADGKFGASWGISQMSLFANAPMLSMAFGDGGCFVKDLLQYTTVKRLDGSLNIDLLDRENVDVNKLCKQVKQDLIKQVKTIGGLKPSESLTFDNQVVVSNNSLLNVEVSEVKVRKSAPINNIVRSLDIELVTKANVKAVAKLRGQWFKGMTTPVEDFEIEGLQSDEDVNIVFNDNSVKNRKAMLVRMWANATDNKVAFCKDGEFRFVEFNEELEVFQTGNVVDLAVVQQELKEMKQSFVISFKAKENEVAEFVEARKNAIGRGRPDLLNQEVELIPTDEEDIVLVKVSCTGIVAPVVFAVELSSVPENLSLNRKTSAVLSSYLTTFGKVSERIKATANRKIAKRASLMAKTISIANNNKADAVFDLTSKCQFNELVLALGKANSQGNARDFFRALSQRWEHGFEVRATDWSIVIPTHVVSVLGGFDKTGRSFDKRVMNLYAFLLLVSENKTSKVVLRDYALGLSRALAWWKDEVAERKGAFTSSARVFDTHGMKVLTSALASTETHAGVEVPVVLLSSDNPLVNKGTVDSNGRAVKAVVDGDVVFFYRNPLLELTPAVVRVVEPGDGVDKWTCAVSASVLTWSSLTDNDGDTLWLVPAKQVGIPNVNKGGSKMVSELMSHPLVGKQISEETLSAWRCGGQMEDIVKSRPDFTVEGILKGVDVDVVDLAEKVAYHYKVRVGQGYSAMFNAYSTFTRKFNNGVSFTHKELMAIKGCAFALYEEFGLSGYSEGNNARFNEIYEQAQVFFGKVKKKNTKGLFKTKSPKVDIGTVAKCATQFIAQTIIQGKLSKGEEILIPYFARSIEDDAVLSGVYRSLTKGCSPLLAKKSPKIEHDPFGVAVNCWMSHCQ